MSRVRTNAFDSTLTVFRKELHDFLRDRRTLVLTLVLGPLMYPLIFLGIGKLTELRMQTQLDRPMDIHIVGAQHAPNLVAWLAGQGIRAKQDHAGTDLAARVDAAIRDQTEDVAVVIAHGKVTAHGTPDELRAQAGEDNLEDAFVRLIGSEEGLFA